MWGVHLMLCGVICRVLPARKALLALREHKGRKEYRVPGIAGAAGVACWDLNANSLCDLATEDINTDTLCDALDCKGDPGTVYTAGTGIGISNNQINVNLDIPDNRHGYFTPGQGARNPRISSIDQTGDVGSYSSVTIGTDGLPVISYYDATNGDLKVARCSNPYCLVNWSRR